MSTTTCVGAWQVDVEQRQPVGARAGAAGPPRRPASRRRCSPSRPAPSAASLQRRALGELGVVVGVAELVGRGLRRVDAAVPVEEHERAVADERHAERSAALAVAWAGVDPLLVDGAVDEAAERRAVRRERVANDAEPVVPRDRARSRRAAARTGPTTAAPRRARAGAPWPASSDGSRASDASTAACIASNVGSADAVGEQRRVERRCPSRAAG